MSKQDELIKQALDLVARLEERKALYAELDAVTLALRDCGFVSTELDGLTLSLVDNFAEGNTVFRPAGVKRFELKVTDPNKKRKAK